MYGNDSIHWEGTISLETPHYSDCQPLDETMRTLSTDQISIHSAIAKFIISKDDSEECGAAAWTLTRTR